MTINLAAFNGDFEGLKRAAELVARANYRQTCVDLLDGILQHSWHELNQFLRLTGVGLAGIVRWEHHKSTFHRQAVRNVAMHACFKMADELKMPRSMAVTTIKPDGTIGKVMDTTEGIHRPLGRYIFNNIRFSKYDPLVDMCREAGYRVFRDPYADDGMLVTFPISWEDVEFDVVDGKHVNLESAVAQLERYKDFMTDYVNHNASITVSYGADEVPEIVEWIDRNWDDYVGVSFLPRNDPTKTAEDLGYPYLPQEVVDKEAYGKYVESLGRLDLEAANTLEEITEDACSTGACPIR